jgi:hypothetical protein
MDYGSKKRKDGESLGSLVKVREGEYASEGPSDRLSQDVSASHSQRSHGSLHLLHLYPLYSRAKATQ